MSHGLFIALEGIGGAGKSVFRKKLTELLEGFGSTVVETREPGGTPHAEYLRNLCRQGLPHEDESDPLDPMGIALLFNAARADHWAKVIKPSIDSGKIVISDRFCDSTFVYQEVVGGLAHARLDALHRVVIGRYPDLTILLDVPAEVAMARVSPGEKSDDRFDRAGFELQDKMRKAYLKLARMDPARYVVIDATVPEDEILDQLTTDPKVLKALSMIPHLAREYQVQPNLLAASLFYKGTTANQYTKLMDRVLTQLG